MGKGLIGMVMAVAIAGSASELMAADHPSARPETLNRVVGCRSIADAAARLACYDAQVAALDQAERDRDVVVVDRSQIRKARRTLFGLDLPDFSLFGGGGDKGGTEEEGTTRIDTTITSARQGPDGKWTMVLQDGARWVQIDTRDVPRSPRGGMSITIRRAAMGSFLANIDKQIAIRVRRVN